MRARELAVLCCLLVPLSGITQTKGTASGRVQGDRNEPIASLRVDFELAQGAVFPRRRNDYDYVLLPRGASLEGLDAAISPQALLRERARQQGIDYVYGTVRTAGAGASAHFMRDGEYGGYLGSGYLYQARIEQGRLRGHLRTGGEGADGTLDVRLDAPIIKRAEGTPLPADGGAPWRDFLRLRDALRAGKEGPIRALLGESILQQLPKDEPFDKVYQSLVTRFPLDATFVSGASTAVDAHLVLTEDVSGKPVRRVVILVPEVGEWKMHPGSFQYGDAPIDAPPPRPFVDLPRADD